MKTLKTWLLSLTSVIVVGLVGVSIWRVWQYVPVLGAVILVSVGLLFIAGVIGSYVFLARLFFHADVIPVEQYGVYIRRFGKVTALPPLNAVTPTIAKTTVKELPAPAFPRLKELIEAGELIAETENGLEMFQGYREDGSKRYGSWPGVIAVGGGQNVGKSVTLLTLIVVALLQGAKVVVCDTHYSKARSLFKKLEALREFITFATTNEQVLAEAEKFSAELASRKRGSNPYPYVFVLDEAASVIKRSEVGKQVVKAIEEASQEGIGYNLIMVLACHDWSKDGLGDVRIRAFFNFVYNHRMKEEMSKFIFSDRKHRKVIAALASGHTYARDEFMQVEYLVMPYGDNTDALAARNVLRGSREIESGRNQERVMGAPRYPEIGYEPVKQIAAPAPDPVTGAGYPGFIVPMEAMEPLQPKRNAPASAPGITEASPQYMQAREASGEASGSAGSVTEALQNEALTSALRAIGKRLKAGETANDIRRSLGVTGGRSLQEVNAALAFIEEHGIEE